MHVHGKIVFMYIASYSEGDAKAFMKALINIIIQHGLTKKVAI